MYIRGNLRGYRPHGSPSGQLNYRNCLFVVSLFLLSFELKTEHGSKIKLTGLVHPENLSLARIVKSLVSVNWIRQSIRRIFVLRLVGWLL